MPDTVDTVEEFWDETDLLAARSSAGVHSTERFKRAFGNLIGVCPDSVYPMPSGRSGLEMLLRNRRDHRRRVLVPAFNCSAVQKAIAASGHDAVLYDFSPTPGFFDWDAVIDSMDSTVGVLVVTHYFGIPIDCRPVLEVCRERGVMLIEDCAHTVGGRIGGGFAGTFGDAAIFSFNYDKPISLGWGGLVVVNTPSLFHKKNVFDVAVLPIHEEMSLMRQFLAAMRTRRKIIPHQNSVMFRALNLRHIFRMRRFLVEQKPPMGMIQAELGCISLARLPDVQKVRNANAFSMATRVRFPTWPVGPEVEATWLRQKVFVDDQELLNVLALRLQRSGIRAGNFNWPDLIEGQGERGHVQARYAAAHSMDVPIHQNLQSRHMTILDEVLGDV